MEIAAIALGAYIMPTARYETHHFGSVNPVPIGASTVGTMPAESHDPSPVGQNPMPTPLRASIFREVLPLIHCTNWLSEE
jgi:hypothetical protein